MKMFPQSNVVFILPPSVEELEKRLKKRKSETPESLQIRMQTARENIEIANNYEF